METCIYKGFVTHKRFKPVKHFFSYKTFSILFDLNELDDLHKNLTFFSFIMFSSFTNSEDKILFSFALSLCVASDLGGILFGKVFKGKKLTKISPNKTISGSIGSYFLSFIFMIAYYFLFNDFEIIFLIILTFIISTISQLGDLLISFLKRKARVKNTSNLLPGHGGLLDRIDGIIFGAPLGFLIASMNI